MRHASSLVETRHQIATGLLRLKWLAAETRFQLALRRHDFALKAGFNSGQPRNELGRWVDTGEPFGKGRLRIERQAGVQFAQIIRICVAGSRSLTTDHRGSRSYWVEYQCAGGRSFIHRGIGHQFRGIVLDPFR